MNKRTREKRVAIVKDAIKQITSNKIVPEQWGYCTMTDIFCHDKDDLKSLLKTSKEPVCYVCALGSLLIADVIKNNNCSVKQAEFSGYHYIARRLANIFDNKILETLEYLFEMGQAGALDNELNENFEADSTELHSSKELELYNLYILKLPSSPKERLLVLLRNIVRNDGELVIPRDIVRQYEKEYKKAVVSCA